MDHLEIILIFPFIHLSFSSQLCNLWFWGKPSICESKYWQSQGHRVLADHYEYVFGPSWSQFEQSWIFIHHFPCPMSLPKCIVEEPKILFPRFYKPNYIFDWLWIEVDNLQPWEYWLLFLKWLWAWATDVSVILGL